MTIHNGTRPLPAILYREPIDTERERREQSRKARVFAALSDPTRLCILQLLIEHNSRLHGPDTFGLLCVHELIDEVNAQLDRFFTQPTISHHLRLLRDADLVMVKKRGLYAYYQVVPAAVVEMQRYLGALVQGVHGD